MDMYYVELLTESLYPHYTIEKHYLLIIDE